MQEDIISLEIEFNLIMCSDTPRTPKTKREKKSVLKDKIFLAFRKKRVERAASPKILFSISPNKKNFLPLPTNDFKFFSSSHCLFMAFMEEEKRQIIVQHIVV